MSEFSFNKTKYIIRKISSIQYNDKDFSVLCLKTKLVINEIDISIFKDLLTFKKIGRSMNFNNQVKISRFMVLSLLYTIRSLIN